MSVLRPAGAGFAALAAVAVLALAACGADDRPAEGEADEAGTAETSAGDTSDDPEPAEEPAEPGGESTDADAARLARRPVGEEGLRVPATRARVVAEESPFGLVLFDANDQVVYAFENDRSNESNCTSADCVKAWPPVLTLMEPSAGAGVDPGLLGTIRRGDGALQVTYNGRPLYFYEHEGPGEIRCHNVDLHGGLWWVLTPQGDPAD